MMLSLQLWIWHQQSLMKMVQRKKYVFGDFELESDKHTKLITQKRIDPHYIGLVKGFYILK